jgi:hypothetical protein
MGIEHMTWRAEEVRAVVEGAHWAVWNAAPGSHAAALASASRPSGGRGADDARRRRGRRALVRPRCKAVRPSML